MVNEKPVFTVQDPKALTDMLAADAKNLELEKKLGAAKSLIVIKEEQLAALTVETEEAQKKVRKAYRALHEKKFSDFNFKHALAGISGRHVISVGGVAKYNVTIPTGTNSHLVSKFVQKPVNDKVEEDLSPVTPAEQILLSYLVSVLSFVDEKKPSPEQDLSGVSLHAKLKMVRYLPAMLIERLADECLSLQTYLNVVLEDELGN